MELLLLPEPHQCQMIKDFLNSFSGLARGVSNGSPSSAALSSCTATGLSNDPSPSFCLQLLLLEDLHQLRDLLEPGSTKRQHQTTTLQHQTFRSPRLLMEDLHQLQILPEPRLLLLQGAQRIQTVAARLLEVRLQCQLNTSTQFGPPKNSSKKQNYHSNR
ncbi:hypothetical protein B9Z55_007858 [Caenorhabditis nigoni]|uniref:Uncharacterized protein n=1 Tax=Caenorhabditis nigoni TaxID=1611254 RepID=A0A2G5VC79_9PELO|nr:hypothetical protein B9Z55_007858 [Caenorhabditis nigoni]